MDTNKKLKISNIFIDEERSQTGNLSFLKKDNDSFFAKSFQEGNYSVQQSYLQLSIFQNNPASQNDKSEHALSMNMDNTDKMIRQKMNLRKKRLPDKDLIGRNNTDPILLNQTIVPMYNDRNNTTTFINSKQYAAIQRLRCKKIRKMTKLDTFNSNAVLANVGIKTHMKIKKKF